MSNVVLEGNPNVEIERKFLVRDESFRARAVAVHRISQGYLSREKGRVVRVRILDNKGFITIKGSNAEGGIAHFEWEREIALQDAQQLLRLCLPVLIEKERYIVPNGATVVEVDVFHGAHEGLVLAEIELPSEDAPYEKPDFLGEEVTQDRRYSNAYLSGHGADLSGQVQEEK